MKGPLLSTSFQHPLSQQGYRAHLAAGSQLLADNTQRRKDVLSVHISLFCCLCRLEGRCQGRQKLEAVLLQFRASISNPVTRGRGTDFVEFREWITDQQKEWAGKDALTIIPECVSLCLKLGQHKQAHELGKGFVAIETGYNFLDIPICIQVIGRL